ncbi:MAG: T9SS type A sorting domain-containing protein [Ignavibacteriales bacterium]|nr:T9SS type A sorting domain-containing protein [Ignavibacteriales bacterium]
MRKLFSLLFLFLIAVAGIKAETPQGVTLHKNSGGYLVNFSLPSYSFETVQANRGEYLKINIADYGITNEIGLPQLPQVSFFLAIPETENTVTTDIKSLKTGISVLEQKIYPFQMPWQKNRPLSERPFSFNAGYYKSTGIKNTPVTVSEPFYLGGVKGVRVTIYPFSYSPVENKLTITEKTSFQLLVKGELQLQNTHSETFNRFLNSVFVNYTGYTSKAAINYLIITAPEFEAGLAPFVSFKTTQGYNVSVVTTAVAGTNTAAIKTFITNRYNDPLQKPEYILLVGDVDKIPNWTGTGSDSPPTDLNYSLLVGNDMFADIFVGRFPITTPTELSNIINKSIYMESYIATLAKNNVFMASTDNYDISEGTHNFVIDTYFQPNSYNNLKLYTHTYNATTQQLRDALNANKLFAIYSGHGSTTSWADGPVFSQSDVRGLTNTVFPFVYSFACITGSYQSSECFAETWIRIPKAGATFYGSSVNSFWDEDDILERRLIKALFDDNVAKVTPMMDKAKVYFVQQYGSLTTDVKRYLEMYNLMGDPSLPTKKVIPPDNTPPAAITNLAAGEPTSSSLKLTWTAPYDSTFGGIASYDIRYSTSMIDTLNFNSAPYYALAASDSAGTPKSFVVDSLQAGTTYYFAVKSRDIWNNVSPISNIATSATLAPPVILATPDSLSATINVQATITDSIIIKNNAGVPSTLNYSAELVNNTFPGKVQFAVVPMKNADEKTNSEKSDKPEINFGQSVKGQGGPDTFGYEWIDSDEPNGPQYIWNDISTTGTLASNWIATGTFEPKDEGYVGPIELGFNFKFYGQTKSQIYVSSDGVILFAAPTTNIYSNTSIPTASEPNSMIAPFWDDLDGRTQGTVHYKQEGSRFIVQFTNWQKYSATGSLTFQVVMYSSGKIIVYYNNMNATLNGATVGIENGAGTDGLQVAYDATYVKNNLAVKIAAEPDWITATNLAGMLYTGNSAALRLTLRSEDYPVGAYRMVVRIKSNDPQHTVVDVPVNMTIVNTQIPVTVLAPNGGENWAVASQKNITWNSNGVTNVDIKYSTDNGTNWLSVASGITASAGTYAWTVPNTSSTQCKVKIINAANAAVFDESNNTFTISQGPVPTGWQAVVNVKDNGNMNKDMTFGLSSIGTNGIDPALGEVSLPPAPPTGVFDTRFELPVTPLDYSLVDFRKDTLQSAAWIIKFQPSTAGYPVILTWNAAALPQGSFLLKDMITGAIVNVDMKTLSTYSLTNTGITALKIEYTKQLSMPMTMNDGWNMFAMPLVASNMTVATLFPQATSSVFLYNSGYTPVTDVIVGKGYWVRYPAASTTITGNPAGLSTVTLNAGWNLIGVYHQSIPVSGLTTTPAGIVNSAYFSFEAGYQTATTLTPCKAYWVRTSQAGVLNLNATTAKGSDNAIVLSPEKDWNRIVITDASGATQTLYAAAKGSESVVSGFALPPTPPEGVFDVRFTSDKNAEVIGAKAQYIRLSGAQYPVTVQVQGSELMLTDAATDGKLINSTLKQGAKVSISNNQVTVLGLSAVASPVSFELMQNYPNPVNPSTSIRFGLPEKSKVTLTIYNQLGEQVAVLLNGEKEAGYHTIEWNAAAQVSGVYFYELKTEKTTSIKKLILMK